MPAPADRALFAVTMLLYMASALHFWCYFRPTYTLRDRKRVLVTGSLLFILATVYLITTLS